jgi:hypothetical protein
LFNPQTVQPTLSTKSARFSFYHEAQQAAHRTLQLRSSAWPSSNLFSLLSPLGGVHTSVGLCFPFFFLRPYLSVTRCAHAHAMGQPGRAGTHAKPRERPSSSIGCSSAAPSNPRGKTQDCSHVAAMARAPWMAVGQIRPCVECVASYKNHPRHSRSYPLRRRRPGDSFPQILCHRSNESEKEKKGRRREEGGDGVGPAGPKGSRCGALERRPRRREGRKRRPRRREGRNDRARPAPFRVTAPRRRRG